MKQITQKELLETIEAKRKSAENAYMKAHMEGRFDDIRKNIDYMEAYIDAYCYIASVEIVPERIEANKGQFVGGNYPEEEIVTTIPKAKQEELGITKDDLKMFIPTNEAIEELKKIDLDKKPITPYNEPKIELLNNDRIREYVDTKGNLHYIDAKEIYYIRISEGYVFLALGKADVISFEKNILDYKELVEWWKYWKQM